MSNKIIPELCEKYIRGTEKYAIVQDVQVLLCNLTYAVNSGIGISCNRVYINTRVLKHIYDKRPAEEFDFLIENIHTVVKYPKYVYLNKTGKKGNFCFVSDLNNNLYMCSVELKKDENNNHSHCEAVTFFRIQKENYLENYELLWEWKGGEPSS